MERLSGVGDDNDFIVTAFGLGSQSQLRPIINHILTALMEY
jgi:hypothetical protein